jgi:Skp family chaperone for outer membrane proteins
MVIALGLLGGMMMWKDSLGQPAPASAPAVPARVAVCDVQEIYANYDRAKDLLTKLNDDRQAAQAENEKRGKAADALQAELTALKPGSPEYENRLNQMERMTIDRKVELQYQEALMLRKHRQMTAQLYSEILAMIGTAAREQGINLVLYRDRDLLETDETMELLAQIRNRKVLYCDSSLDITQTVLARLNEAYRASGGK